ncbi:MAG: ATP-dependent DNA helicase RecG [Treponemataceae bacterium]|nr:ATP-dependent DNA helicase RecG [Treponemataceae bacterium]
MQISAIKTPVESLGGVGPATGKLFAKLNIFTVGDLLSFYPRDYEDRRKRVSLSQFEIAKVHTVAQVVSHQWFGYSAMKTLKIIISDGDTSAALICFNRQFLEKSLPVGCIISVTGTFSVKYGQIQSTAFDVTKLAESGNVLDYKDAPLPDSMIIPNYPLTEGLTQKVVRKAIGMAIKQYDKGIETELPQYIIEMRKILPKSEAIRLIHQGSSPEEIQNARYALIYEELFNLQTAIAERAYKHRGEVPPADLKAIPTITGGENRDDFEITKDAFEKDLSPLQKRLYTNLNFFLTQDQMKVICQMNHDIDRGYMERSALSSSENIHRLPFTMQRLLQGDVGSGKTLVSFFACLRVIEWKGQCALMAPTEILARQHAENASKFLEPYGIKVAFLTGNTKTSGRTTLLKALKSGEIDILIGTHALFSKQTEYKDLQLAIIDEQHRFGVVQRQAIIDKGRKTNAHSNIPFEPHLLMMSATPIPQTLALTVFGDLDVSVIKTMPHGRKPIQTYLVKQGNEANAYNAVRKELKDGHQAYFVYPAIDAANITQELKSAEEAFKNLSENIYPEYKCALVHSKIDDEEQIRILKEFREGKINVLASTTVIEVGVDVPNASCIIIEQADRFGLAQLHQLRGRVGRGAEQSYCFLIYSNKITETGIERMKIVRQNTDGFVIAEEDLKLRGPGEITGTVQAGALTLGIADLSRDHDILLQARADAFEYVSKRH